MSEVSSFFRLDPQIRYLVADYLVSYQEGSVQDKAYHEVIVLAKEHFKIKEIFQQKVSDLQERLSPSQIKANCYSVLLSSSKDNPTFLGPGFKIYPFAGYALNYSEMIKTLYETLFHSNYNKETQIDQLIKYAQIIGKDRLCGVLTARIEKATNGILKGGHGFKEKSTNKEINESLKEYNQFCSIYLHTVEFFYLARLFLTESKKKINFETVHQLTTYKKRLFCQWEKADLFIKTVLNLSELEERAFFYRWIELQPKQEDPSHYNIFTKLKAHNLEDFKKKYLSHPNPNIRLMAAGCIDITEKTSMHQDYIDSVDRFTANFILINGFKNFFKIFTSEPFLIFPEFLSLIDEFEKKFSFKLPEQGSGPKRVFNTTYTEMYLKNPLKKEEIAYFESKLDALNNFLPNLHFLYNLGFTGLTCISRIQKVKKVKIQDPFEDMFTAKKFLLNHQKITLPDPSKLKTFFSESDVTQLEIEDFILLQEEKDEKRDTDYKEDVCEVTSLQPVEPSLQKLLNIRDFPRHNFCYDARVTEWFTKLKELNCNWEKAPWDVQCHAFASSIDLFVGTVFSKKSSWSNTKTGHQDLLYLLFADIILGPNNSFSVTIEYTKGSDRVWYHRYMNRHKNVIWHEIRTTELQKSANARQGGQKTLPETLGDMTLEPLSDTLMINFGTYQIRLHRLRGI